MKALVNWVESIAKCWIYAIAIWLLFVMIHSKWALPDNFLSFVFGVTVVVSVLCAYNLVVVMTLYYRRILVDEDKGANRNIVFNFMACFGIALAYLLFVATNAVEPKLGENPPLAIFTLEIAAPIVFVLWVRLWPFVNVDYPGNELKPKRNFYHVRAPIFNHLAWIVTQCMGTTGVIFLSVLFGFKINTRRLAAMERKLKPS